MRGGSGLPSHGQYVVLHMLSVNSGQGSQCPNQTAIRKWKEAESNNLVPHKHCGEQGAHENGAHHAKVNNRYE
jgi:hypothetical protein